MPDLLLEILYSFDAFDALNVGYLHYQVIKVFGVVDVNIYCPFKDSIFN